MPTRERSQREREIEHEGGDPDEDRIPGFSSTNVADLRKGFHGCSRRVIQLILEAFLWVPKAQYLLFNSVYEFEDQVYEKIRTEYTLPIYSIGPAIHFLFEFEENYVSKSISSPNGTRSYLEWLDSQSAGSVLYVSLGSYLSVSSEQMDEIAAGLTSSCVRLLWVARDETSRLKNSCGDQFKVLGHSSVGGFWTHCGFGCPLLTLPLHFYSTFQREADCRKLEGWVECEGKAGDENTVRREEIAKLVQEFMDRESIEVQNIRKRAKQLGEICHQAVEKGGSSETNMDVFINHISQDHSS
ncbi:hypothetical protein Q3G72_003697 [Acer saccharum]|nr:hypothetical protein Q3G72_003697 [Acer saccharum]